MTVLITLTLAENDTGPFDLYTNVDGFTDPFVKDVPKSLLVAGYETILVPDNASIIRVKCKGTCTNYIDINCRTQYFAFNVYDGASCLEVCQGFSTAKNQDFFNLL